MNKYVRAIGCMSIWMFRVAIAKVFHVKGFSASLLSLVSPFSEITMDKNAVLKIEKGFKMRDGAKIRVRGNGVCTIGKNTSVNSYNMIACHERVEIGSGCQFSPNVQIYDHDHDFMTVGGINEMKYKTSPVYIGNNVWIGANTVILRGTEIGDNCVVAAGSIIKGKYPANTLIVQKKVTEERSIIRKE